MGLLIRIAFRHCRWRFLFKLSQGSSGRENQVLSSRRVQQRKGGQKARWSALYRLWKEYRRIELDGKAVAIGEHIVQLVVRGAGGCSLWNTTYRFRVTESSKCRKVQHRPCEFVIKIPNLPNRTLAALKNQTSPQAKAYKWVTGRARSLLNANPMYCIDALTNLFGITTFMFSHGVDFTRYFEGEFQDSGCRPTGLCDYHLKLQTYGFHVLESIQRSSLWRLGSQTCMYHCILYSMTDQSRVELGYSQHSRL